MADSSGPGRGGPARGYSWPPFQPGNKVRLRHGARDPALVEPRARELVPSILEANPHLDAGRDGAAVYRYAVALARIERVYRWLSEQPDPVFADERAGAVHAVYERLERWERQAERAEQQLAIGPLVRTKLGLTRLAAYDVLAEVMREQEERERRELLEVRHDDEDDHDRAP
jgi:hypothetical protein